MHRGGPARRLVGVATILAMILALTGVADPSPARAAPPASAAKPATTTATTTTTDAPAKAPTDAAAAPPIDPAGASEPAASARPISSRATYSSDRCDGAWTIDRLSLAQRQILFGACMGGSVDGGRMQALMRHLLGSDLWHSGALAWLVSPRAPLRIVWAAGHDQSKAPAIDALQRQLDERVRRFAGGGLCPAVRSSKALAELLAAADEDREPDDLPFDADFLDCVGIGSAAGEGSRLLTVRVDGLESLVVAFATPTYAIVRHYGRDDMLTLGKHRFVVLAVPEGTPATLVGERASHETPLFWRALVGHNQAVWMTPVRYACVDFDIKYSADDRLFVDGREVMSSERDGRVINHALTLARDLPRAAIPDHQATVIRCAKGGECEIRYASTFAATVERAEARNVCHEFRLDLRERTRQQVAILNTSRSETCERSPLRVNTLRDRVRFILSTDPRHDRREVAEVAVYAQVASALASLAGEIDRAAGQANGPDRGVDSNEALGTVAKEAWRQGLDVLMNFELQCLPRPGAAEGDDAWDYSIQATMIQVDEIFSRGYYGEEGLNLDRFIHKEAVTFSEPDLQESALAVILDRLFEVPMSRFIHEEETIAYRAPIAVRVGSFFAADQSVPETVSIVYKRIPRRRRYGAVDATAEAYRPAICDRLSRAGRSDAATLREAEELLQSLPGRAHKLGLGRSRRGVDHSVSRQGAIHRRDLRVREPGWYLVGHYEGDRLGDAFCVDARYPARETWGEVNVAGGPMVLTATDLQIIMTRIRVARVRYLLPNLGVGLRGGYAFVDYFLSDGVASWQDLGVQSPALRWRRHGVQIGPVLEVRSRWTALPFEVRARVSPYVDVGLIPLGGVPAGLAEFRTSTVKTSLLDVDVGADLDLGVSYEVGPVTIQHGVFFNWSAIDDDRRRTGITVKENFSQAFGFMIGIGGNAR